MGYDILKLLLSTKEHAFENLEELHELEITTNPQPYLVNNLLELVSDDGGYIRALGAERAIRLFNMVREYRKLCMSYYLDFIVDRDNLGEIIKFKYVNIYRVQAPNGDRLATVSEIENGVKELYVEKSSTLDEEEIKKLYLLLWTYTGKVRYYQAAGLQYDNKERKEITSGTYEIIKATAWKLRELLDWIANDNYNKVVPRLKANKKRQIAYAAYAEDEISVSESPKFILHACINKVAKKPMTNTQRRVAWILENLRKSRRKATPEEVSLMRQAYYEYQRGYVEDTGVWKDAALGALCERLEKGREDGYITANIVCDILGKARLYGKVSEKQLNILNEADKELADTLERERRGKIIEEGKKKREEAKNNKENSNIDEIVNIYDALGSGDLNS